LIRIRTAVAVLAIAIPLPAAVAGCGGGSSSSSEDPQQVLDQTFNNPTKITSGNVNISISGSAQGAQSGDVSATIDGPFESSGPTQFPQFDLNAKISASGAGQNFSFDGALIATQDNAYVDYQNQAYEVGTDIFKQFQTAYAQQAKQSQAQGGSKSASSVFSQFGIDPKTWLTNISNEGTTDVDGTSTIHIHGDADVAKIVADLQKVSQATQSGTTSQLTPQQIDQLKSSIKSASIDVYSGSDDHLLRKLALTMAITPPASTGSPVSSVDLNFSVTLSDVNNPQTISGPSNAKPIADLLSQFGLGGVPGLGSTGTGPLVPPGGSTGGSSSGAYLKCVNQATTPADINSCAQKLQ
jgi:hypothetical protein